MSVTVREWTEAEARAEIARLEALLPCRREDAPRYAQFDADVHQILRRIASLHWLIEEEDVD